MIFTPLDAAKIEAIVWLKMNLIESGYAPASYISTREGLHNTDCLWLT